MHMVVLAVSSFLLVGCGNALWTSIWRDAALNSDQVIAVDARQRFLHSQRDPDGVLHVCAERSPDVFTAAASALAASGSSADITAALSASSSESAASNALRTQTTQTQAELLYRLCALHASGGLTGPELSAQLRRFQNTMLAMLAVEQLTGPARVAAFAIGADGSGSAGGGAENVPALRQSLTSAREAVRSAITKDEEATATVGQRLRELEARQAALTAAGPDAANRPDLANQVSTAQAAAESATIRQNSTRRDVTDARRAEQEASRALREAGGRVTTAGGTSASFPVTPGDGTIGDPTASAVRDIVQLALRQSFIQETCLQQITSPASRFESRRVNPEIIDFCRGIIHEIVRQRGIETQLRFANNQQQIAAWERVQLATARRGEASRVPPIPTVPVPAVPYVLPPAFR